MSVSVMVDDLEQLRRYLRLKTLDLLGHSGGAMIVLGYAERYSSRVRNLILVDGTPIDTFPSPFVSRAVDSRRSDPRFAAAILQWDHPQFSPTDAGFSRYLDDLLPLYFFDPVRFVPVFAATLRQPIDYWVTEHNGAADKAQRMPQSKLLSQVTARTLVLVGRADFICPVEDSQQIARGIAGSQLIIFEKTGHIPWIEARERFFDVVNRFFAKAN